MYITTVSSEPSALVYTITRETVSPSPSKYKKLHFLTVDVGPDGFQHRFVKCNTEAFSFSGHSSDVYLSRSSFLDRLTYLEGLDMTLYNQIQQLIIRCIAREITVAVFREQFVPLFFSINRKFDIDAVTLADNVDNLYSDVLIGAATDDEFRKKLVQLTPIVMTAEVGRQGFEWVFGSMTATPEPAGTGPKNPTSETSSDVQLLQYA